MKLGYILHGDHLTDVPGGGVDEPDFEAANGELAAVLGDSRRMS